MKAAQTFLLLSFLEGASVMAAELIGAKMMAPFFGSSLYVWSAVMAITLGGLASGYFTGGFFSSKKDPEKALYKVLVLAAVFMILLPFTGKFTLHLFGYLSLLPAVTISSLIILFPPVFMMGMVSPLIIRNITRDVEHAGQAAGTIYAISTLGGILATFAFGFWIIPYFGLSYPAIITGIVLGIYPAILLLKKKDFSGLALLFFFFWMLQFAAAPRLANAVKLVYNSEGLLGQVMILDFPNDIYSGDTSRHGQYTRWLFVNRVSQSMYNPYADTAAGEEMYFSYIHQLETLADTFSIEQPKALVLGLGGGSAAQMLYRQGFQVEVCELDARMEYVARNYFGLSPEVKVNIDDARHFIRTTKNKYDLILFDTFKGEDTPSHLITRESIEEIKTLLSENGILLINSFGFIEGEKGRGARCIFKTIRNAGLEAIIWPTHEDVETRNLVFVAGRNPIPDNAVFYSEKELNLEDALVLSDEYPLYEIINAPAGLSWRRAVIQSLKKDPYQGSIPVFE